MLFTICRFRILFYVFCRLRLRLRLWVFVVGLGCASLDFLPGTPPCRYTFSLPHLTFLRVRLRIFIFLMRSAHTHTHVFPKKPRRPDQTEGPVVSFRFRFANPLTPFLSWPWPPARGRARWWWGLIAYLWLFTSFSELLV